MNSQPYIVGIGAANVDLSGRAFRKARFSDSNPGTVTMSAGGVTRNILENYARMGGKCCLLGVIGDDGFGQHILQSCHNSGVDVSHIRQISGSSSSYVSIIDEDGEMLEAVSDMRIMQQLTVDYIRENDNIIRGSQLIVCDPSIPSEVMDYLLDNYGNDFCVDPVSTAYARSVKPRIGRFAIAKPNVLETEILADMPIRNHDDLVMAAERLIEKGLRKVFITRGPEGCLYYGQDGQLLEYRLPVKVEAVNVTGAGDAFMAGVLYGTAYGMNVQDIMKTASAASWIALESSSTVSPEMSRENIERKLKEI
ncbi:MAG: carbohydrate kinase family protein [Erysipelotrichaceae bacterium]|nr:carbohydrate kinase family protein [Erysipelotrichaceae bacterium]